jgi:molybdate transport system substrate-binding protein
LLSGLVACSGDDRPAPGAAGTDRGLTGSVVVLAAASLTESFTALGERFEQDNPGVDVQFSFAASSELATQVTERAPADVFASASTETMQQVVETGAVAGEPRLFARNRLQIAVPPDNPGHVTSLTDLARADLTIALCAPEVPCGSAADQVFAAAGVTPAPDTLEADVKATVNKVRLGEVDAALVYRTDVLAAGDDVLGIDFPESRTAVNDYPVALLDAGPNPEAARAFVELVLSGAGRGTLSAAGFDLP